MPNVIKVTKAYINKPLHPRRMQKGMRLYTDMGQECMILDMRGQCGQWQIQTAFVIDGVNKYRMYEYDEHDYNGDGGGDMLPLLYKKNPRG